jgi:hypothetical protein
MIKPRWQSRPYKQTPARREYIYGKVQPMRCNTKETCLWVWFACIVICLGGYLLWA